MNFLFFILVQMAEINDPENLSFFLSFLDGVRVLQINS